MTFDFLGVSERREVLEGLHFMVACYMFRAVFFGEMGRDFTSHCPVEAEFGQLREVWKFARGRERGTVRTVDSECVGA